ncbi:MAG: competence protein CoiA [Chlamydiales bacterium]
MQCHAYNVLGNRVQATEASRGLNYTCPECGGVVRLRGGQHRQLHFYHLHPPRECRQSGKSLMHLHMQLRLQKIISPEKSVIEHPFPSIGRIADVVWPAEKLLFEVQCSPISADELTARNRDYASINYRVIWLFWDRRFNKKRLAPALLSMKETPYYYFTDGKNIIYDQYRQFRTPINILKPQTLSNKLPPELIHRAERALYFSSDIVDLFLTGKLPLPQKKSYAFSIKKLYFSFFQRLIEKV